MLQMPSPERTKFDIFVTRLNEICLDKISID